MPDKVSLTHLPREQRRAIALIEQLGDIVHTARTSCGLATHYREWLREVESVAAFYSEQELAVYRKVADLFRE